MNSHLNYAPGLNRALRLTEIRKQILMFSDSLTDSVTCGYGTLGGTYSGVSCWLYHWPVHHDGQNAVFVDGHAQYLRTIPRPDPLVGGSDCADMLQAYFWPVQ